MASVQSPQLGYNHNIPHRGRLYHVQTEDSGVDRAHIFTHVFFDGTIIASNKVEYRDRLGESNLDPVIIGLMQDSHKAMIRRLRSGDFDEKIVGLIGEHPLDSNRAAPAAEETMQRPERRAVPAPRDVEPQGPPLRPGHGGPAVDPSLAHPVMATPAAAAQLAPSATSGAPARPSGGPASVRRRAIGGIGGQGVRADGQVPIAERRDIIVGKFASEHQAELDEEILALLRDE